MKRPIPSDQDSLYAFALLFGLPHSDSDRELGKRIFPSQNTKPTEKEAREALARILRSNQVSSLILMALAEHIDPSGGMGGELRRIEFKNRSRRHPRTGDHVSIASRVYELRKKKEKNAIAKVAKEIGKDPRHVARI
jgi:hypothetical protein